MICDLYRIMYIGENPSTKLVCVCFSPSSTFAVVCILSVLLLLLTVNKRCVKQSAKYSCEGVEKTLVIVVSNTTAILNFTQHVAHRVPRHALHTCISPPF